MCILRCLQRWKYDEYWVVRFEIEWGGAQSDIWWSTWQLRNLKSQNQTNTSSTSFPIKIRWLRFLICSCFVSFLQGVLFIRFFSHSSLFFAYRSTTYFFTPPTNYLLFSSAKVIPSLSNNQTISLFSFDTFNLKNCFKNGNGSPSHGSIPFLSSIFSLPLPLPVQLPFHPFFPVPATSPPQPKAPPFLLRRK